ncbi:MAG: hypothetical protein KatS3mg053_3923 [Candidatus Roseilinea sp.]|nr:MAG: hypothetical protein KatS3mg053_3923 [Candidatus Roseilinea sp.]GIV84030.1 MAG: hypothetical protein KatS3mg052_1037 [Candidatus Roseilinea sp.]
MALFGERLIDLERIKRDIATGPIGLYVSMCFAYAMLCALIAASTVNELLEDGRHLLQTPRLDLQLEFKALIVLCHEKLGYHTLPSADFIPETAQLDRVIGFIPSCMKSAWPGPAAVPRAP